jgi:hypothetical protein
VFIVRPISLWPSVFITVRGEALAASRKDAHEWRRSWSRTPLRRVRGLMVYQARFTLLGSSGTPRCVVNTRPLSCHALPAASWSAFCFTR